MIHENIDWEALVEGADRAPSGDNSQPWKVRITKNILELYFVQKKDLGFYDMGNTSTYLALGGWLHNFTILAAQNGYRTDITLIPSGEQIARITLEQSTMQSNMIASAASVYSRRTNRFPYENRPIAADQKLRLEKVLLPYGVSLSWIEGKNKDELQNVLPKLHRITWTLEKHRKSLLSLLMLGKASDALTGLHRSHLGIALKGLPAVLGIVAARHSMLAWKMVRIAMSAVERRNIKHASAVVLLSAKAPKGLTLGTHREFWLTMGMALEEFWLATTSEHLAVQPLYTIIELGLRRFFGLPLVTEKYAVLEERAHTILRQYCTHENEIAFMCMRIGVPKTFPKTLSLRKPVKKILIGS